MVVVGTAGMWVGIIEKECVQPGRDGCTHTAHGDGTWACARAFSASQTNAGASGDADRSVGRSRESWPHWEFWGCGNLGGVRELQGRVERSIWIPFTGL